MTEQHGVSALDRAQTLRLTGDRTAALRLSASILVANPEDVAAAALTSRLLAELGDRSHSAKTAQRLVDAFIRRGELAPAVLAAKAAGEAGSDQTQLLAMIANAFGKGSPRVGDVSQKPPPLPANVETAPFFAELSGTELIDKAGKALERFVTGKDPLKSDGTVPRLPLFGALEPPVLAKLLAALLVREVAAGDTVVEQGAEGREAFIVGRGLLNVVRTGGGKTTLLAALGPGAIFGEMALVSEAPRAGSVIAVESTQLLVADRPQLEQLAAKEPQVGRELGAFCHSRMVANLIRHSVFLAAVDPKKREDLMSRFETRTLAPGAQLVKQGQEAAGLFLIASGGVQVSSKDSDGDTVVVAQLGPGDVVGEISLLLRRPATADVHALHPTVALELTRERFQAAIREHPTLLSELYELATQRDEETRSVVAQEALDVEDVVLL
jgi:cAMP-dependent protein kinase regulator